MSVLLRRSKTVCDVRPSDEINGDKSKRKKGIFNKIFRSFAKLGKKKQFQSTSNLESSCSKFASVAGSDSGVGSSAFYNLPGTSFADPPREHHHGSDSASTGYVSEGSSRRTANGRFSVDLEKENKLAKRAHARFRSDDSETSDTHRLATRSNINVFTLRASDTDLDRDETDLNTDEERDSSDYTDGESQESYSDSFYSSESSSTTSEDDNSQRGRKRNSEKRKKASKDSSPVRSRNAPTKPYQNRTNLPKRSRSALPTIQRTVSANPVCYSPNIRDFKPSPSAPSPALRARILRLELGETIPTEDENATKIMSKEDEKSQKNNDLSPLGGAVKNIAAKFKAKSEAKIDTESEERSSEEMFITLGRSKSVMSPPMVASGIVRTKRNPVLEKFAPKLKLEPELEEKSHSSGEKKESQPVSLRRTQSTKVLDLAATLFRPGDEITTESDSQKTRRNAPVRSQTMKLTSPKSVIRRQSSANDSFIRELLEIAKSESNEPKNNEPRKMNDFKSQISMASTKIIRRKTMTSADDVEKAKALTKIRAHSVVSTQPPLFKAVKSNDSKSTTELDPFVEDILNNKTVPQAVKQKIREECWSLFNDPKTPKGVKQCILNTMMTKSQTE